MKMHIKFRQSLDIIYTACLLVGVFFAATRPVGAQPGLANGPKVIKITTAVEPASALKVGDVVTLRFTLKIDKGYHAFSAITPANNGYRPTQLELEETSAGVELVGTLTEEGQRTEKRDEIMEDLLRYYNGTVTFRQRVKVKSIAPKLRVLFSYQYCTDDEGQCWYKTEEFDFPLQVKEASANPAPLENSALANPISSTANPTRGDSATPTLPTEDPADAQGPTREVTPVNPVNAAPPTELWWLFIQSFGAGLLALFTPCVFPMIPLTVSFFTKRGGTRSRGLRMALLYGASIVVIFVSLGLLLTVVTGQANIAYQLSTNPWVNLFFFVLLIAFGLSFLGLFEITLPASWANAVDSKSGVGGVGGIFFMALTLVLVSFSCTAPLVGTLLFQAVQGSYLGPTVGMFGFSLAFAIPFGLFAAFPGLLSGLPKSGGWLNSIKVVLGFLELALAFKFLSNADLVWHAGILDREVYLAGWIAIFILLGLYLAGRYQLPHDTPLERVGVGRLILSLLSFWFVLYLIPGLWGAPLEMLGGFLPNPKPDQVGVLTVDSAAPSAQGWIAALLDREIVVGLLITLFVALSLFFLKKLPILRFPHEHVSVPRLMGSLFSLWMAVYLFPGLWGAPLPVVAGLLPPPNSDMGVRLLPGAAGASQTCNLPKDRKLADKLADETPQEFCAFYDLEEGLAYARKVGKPVLLDFTGHTCANCRLMEQNVWRQPQVKSIIAQNYVLVSLFVDEAQKLPATVIDPQSGSKLRTLGDMFLQLQQNRYGTSAQPYYALLNPAGADLTPARGYTPEPDAFRDFLLEGLEKFEAQSAQ